MNKTIGVLAHVDAGKTTFCEQVLFHTNTIRKRGRVDHKDTFLDSHELEKNRGITIFSEQGNFIYNDSNYYLIDTPGHIDFSPEMERAIKIMDYAVLIISGVEKVQSHTETVFRLLKKYKVPVFIFVNKMDRDGANKEEILKEIHSSLSRDAIEITEDFYEHSLNENLIEFIADRDNNLLELYLDGNYKEELWIESMKNMIKKGNIYPCYFGSALQDIGISKFIEILDKMTYTSYCKDRNFVGTVYKIKHDESGNRLTFIKALEGSVKPRDEVQYINNNEKIYNKISQIRLYNGSKFAIRNSAQAGQLFTALGITDAMPGDYITVGNIEKEKIDKLTSLNTIELIPNMKSKLLFDSSLNINDVFKYFKILESEEPALSIDYDDILKEIHINVMGKIQLEILKEIARERFDISVDFGPCEILYKETICEKTVGYGHFEPLGHYAEVHLRIEPAPRNSGINFKSIAHVDNLQPGHQNLVKTHLFEKVHRGILGGFELTDLRITLLNGRAHNKHTSGGDFREATLRALRQGIEQVENIILEPYYKFKI